MKENIQAQTAYRLFEELRRRGVFTPAQWKKELAKLDKRYKLK